MKKKPFSYITMLAFVLALAGCASEPATTTTTTTTTEESTTVQPAAATMDQTTVQH